MNIEDKFNRLEKTFKKLQYILELESENNWSMTIAAINYKIEGAISVSEKKIVINEVSKTFKNIYAGNGSFSDYCIWRNDPEERVKINKEFGSLIDEIWFLIK